MQSVLRRLDVAGRIMISYLCITKTSIESKQKIVFITGKRTSPNAIDITPLLNPETSTGVDRDVPVFPSPSCRESYSEVNRKQRARKSINHENIKSALLDHLCLIPSIWLPQYLQRHNSDTAIKSIRTSRAHGSFSKGTHSLTRHAVRRHRDEQC